MRNYSSLPVTNYASALEPGDRFATWHAGMMITGFVKIVPTHVGALSETERESLRSHACGEVFEGKGEWDSLSTNLILFGDFVSGGSKMSQDFIFLDHTMLIAIFPKAD